MARLAYIILAHKYPEQLARLIRALSNNKASFFIHVDKKTDILLFRKALENLHISKITLLKREDGGWGRIGMVKAALNGIIEVLGTKEYFSHIILLSGQDYPIKNITAIHDFFEKNYNKNYFHFFNLPHKSLIFGGMDRIERSHFRLLGRSYTYPPYEEPKGLRNEILHKLFGLYFPYLRSFPRGLKPYGGSDWWCMNLEAAAYIINFLNLRPDYLKFHRYSISPAEGFFQTILLNASDQKLIETVVNDNCKYIDWSCGGKSPSILTTNYFIILKDSEKLFARKFDMNIDSHILDMIDEEIISRA